MTSKPLRRTLTIQSFLAVLIPFGVVFLLGILWAVPKAGKDAAERQLQLAQAVAIQVQSHLNAGAVIVRAASTLPVQNGMSRHHYQQRLDALLAATDFMSTLYAVTPDGRVPFVGLSKEKKQLRPDLVNVNLSQNPLWKAIAREKRALWSETFLSVITGGLTVAYGVPGPGYTLMGEVDLTLLTRFLQQIGSGKEILILVLDDKGQIIADNDGRYTAQQLNVGNVPFVHEGLTGRNPATGRFHFAGNSMTGSIVKIAAVNWHVVVARTNLSLYRSYQDMTLVVLAGILTALACGMLVSAFQARKLSMHFSELAHHAAEVSAGRESGAWPSSSVTEFNQLSATLQQMAHRLQDSETLYRTLFEQLPEGVVLWSATEHRPIQFNSAAHRLLGYSREEFGTLAVADIEAQKDAAAIAEADELLHRAGSLSFETAHRCKNGELRSMYVTLQHIELDRRSMVLAVHRDVTELKNAEREKRKSEELFHGIMELSPDVISIISAEGTLIYNSPAMTKIHGYLPEEMQGVDTFALIHPEDREPVRAALGELLERLGSPVMVQYRYRNKDGSYYWMECSASNQFANPLINGIIAISRNISDRKKLEEASLALERQLLHAQKLESLGILAGGIAHDFNNILTSIVGNADLALMKLKPSSPAVENLERIERASARAADLARQMLAYSGRGKFLLENLDLNAVLEEMVHMLEVSISKKAVLRLNPYHPLPCVEADATQLRQIIMNLVINASEAIGDRSGTIAISTGCMDCDRSYLKGVWLDENLKDGLYVFLEVADTGCGMDKETLARIFDPFFTTKFTGRGLGMAAVLGIVRGHKGAIKVYSEPGKGTTFKILLPANSRPADMFHSEPRQDDWRGSGTVLLVDDEETVRALGKEMLQELGFSVVTADDGREAVALYKATPDVRIVILDLTMPHMDGEQCFRELRLLNPEVKVIMSSGYNEQEVTQRFMGKGLAGFIQKPYKLKTLKDAIRAIA